jgi:GntR family transcriptional regulator, transcriptional repressor for pyruvate dehydrogenase complex
MAEQEKAGKPAATASREITARLVRGILAGTWPAGGKLPTEREMHQHFGVSRHVVREALKRLEAMGLVRIQQGSGAWVNDVFLSGGIELFEYLLLDDKKGVDSDALRDFFTFWKLFLPEAYRLAAQNRTDEDLAELGAVITARSENVPDPWRRLEDNQRIIQLIARASGNTIYQLIVNNVTRVIQRLRSEIAIADLLPLFHQEHLDRIWESLEDRDGEMAALLGARQVENTAECLLAYFGDQASHA